MKKYAVIGLILSGCASGPGIKQVEVCEGDRCDIYNAKHWYTRDCGTSGLPGQCRMVENIRVDLRR